MALVDFRSFVHSDLK
jgi:U3 small nucleolar RNA-associated protein 10